MDRARKTLRAWHLSLWIALLSTLPAQGLILADHLSADKCDLPTTTRLDDTKVSANLIEDLLSWIAEATTYDVAPTRDDPPNIWFCQAGDTIPYESDKLLVEDTLQGLYDLPNRRVFLVRPWNPASPRDRAVLLHELVHHVQLSNRSYDCLGEPEWEAYKLQEAYLKQHGIDPEFDWLQIYFLSRCPRDIHP